MVDVHAREAQAHRLALLQLLGLRLLEQREHESAHVLGVGGAPGVRLPVTRSIGGGLRWPRLVPRPPTWESSPRIPPSAPPGSAPLYSPPCAPHREPEGMPSRSPSPALSDSPPGSTPALRD